MSLNNDDFNMRLAMKSLQRIQQATGGGSFSQEAQRNDDVREKLASLTGYKLAEYKTLLEIKGIRENFQSIEELEMKHGAAHASKKAGIATDISRRKQKIRKSMEQLKNLQKESQREANKDKAHTEVEVKELIYHVENAKRLYRDKFSSANQPIASKGDGDDSMGSQSSFSRENSTSYGTSGVNNLQDLGDATSSVATGVSLRDDDAFMQFFQSVEQNNLKMDQQFDRIHHGLQRLAENAKTINDELNLQSHMIDDTEAKVDKVTTRVKELNRSLKKTIAQVDSDKMCLYLCCCLVLISLAGGVLYAAKIIHT